MGEELRWRLTAWTQGVVDENETKRKTGNLFCVRHVNATIAADVVILGNF